MEWDACWLPEANVPETLTAPAQIAGWELQQQGVECTLELENHMGDAYEIADSSAGYVIRGGETGVLYGAYRLLISRRAGVPLPRGIRKPALALRMVCHRDRLPGMANRPRLRAYARLLASISVNVICVYNRAVSHPGQGPLAERFLPEIAELAALFGAFGIQLLLAVEAAMPPACGLPDAEPTHGRERWMEWTKQVYRHVPTLLGYMADTDTEDRGEPDGGGSDDTQRANMLAKALEPYGGLLLWRCSAHGYGRNVPKDDLAAAYKQYMELDGRFDDNVIVQITYGPYGFRVREPVNPLLLAMPRTAKGLELYLAQEETCRGTEFYALQELWNEVMAELPHGSLRAITIVVNGEPGACLTGEPLAQLNLFAYGMMAWQPVVPFELVTRLWIQLTYAPKSALLQTFTDMVLMSREVYEKSTAPLGLRRPVSPEEGGRCKENEFEGDCPGYDTGRYAVGVDRTEKGTGLLGLYPSAQQIRYHDPATCPEKLLLFFHRLPYTYRMRDGRTLIQRLYDDYDEGTEEAGLLAEKLKSLRAALPEETYDALCSCMQRRQITARERRDAAFSLLRRLSGIGDEKGRL